MTEYSMIEINTISYSSNLVHIFVRLYKNGNDSKQNSWKNNQITRYLMQTIYSTPFIKK